MDFGLRHAIPRVSGRDEIRGGGFKHKLGLDPIRSQLRETALSGAEDYPTIEHHHRAQESELVQGPLCSRPPIETVRRRRPEIPLLHRFLSQQGNVSRPLLHASSMASSAATRFMKSGSSTVSSNRMISNTAYRKPFG